MESKINEVVELETVTNAPEQVEVPQIALESVVEPNCSLVNNYDWTTQTAWAICMAESRGNPNAVNWADGHSGCVGSFGLMQIACIHFSEGQDKFDPATNMQVAYELWKSSGWSIWGAFSDGNYLRFMD